MSNRPNYYKLRERASSRKQSTQISQFFANQDVPQGSKESCDTPPLKRPREKLETPESMSITPIKTPSSECSKTNSPLNEEGDVKPENVLSKIPPVTDKNKRETKKKARSLIKEFFDQNDSDVDLGAPKKKMTKKVTAQKTTSRGKRVGGRSRSRQTTIKSVLLKNEEIFSEFIAQHSATDNVDSYELQLALALSKSEVETSGQGSDSVEEESSEKCNLLRNTKEKLQQYGFKITNNERDYDIIFKAGSKKGKWANKFTPLTLRNPEKQAKKLEEKIAQILKCFSSESASSHPNEEFVLTSEILEMFIATREPCLILHQIQSSYIYDYYVSDLFTPTDTKADYLLKDWRKIPGRDLSPCKTTETKNYLPEAIPSAPENENRSAEVIPGVSENENESSEVISGVSENRDTASEIIASAPEHENGVSEVSLGAPQHKNGAFEVLLTVPARENHSSELIPYVPANELSQELKLNDSDRLAVNVSQSINISVDHPEIGDFLCVQDKTNEEEKDILLDDPDANTIKWRKENLAISEKESKIVSDRPKEATEKKYEQRETSPDLFADSDISLCEGINDADIKKVPSASILKPPSEEFYPDPDEDNFVISYEKYSTDETKVFSDIKHKITKPSNIEFVSQVSLEEDCIDLTGHSDTDSLERQEIENYGKSENNEFSCLKSIEAVESNILPINVLEKSQKSDYSDNLSQSQNLTEKDLTEGSCIILSDDEVNYSIKVANKTFRDTVDLTFNSSSEENESRKNCSMKVSHPIMDQENFSFIALIGEDDTVSPSKSNDSLDIDSPMKMSQTTSFQHSISIPAKKSLSFSNCNANTSIGGECKISPNQSTPCNVELVGEKFAYDEQLNAAAFVANKPQGDSLSADRFTLLLDKSSKLDKQTSLGEEYSDDELIVSHANIPKRRKSSKTSPQTITSTVEKKFKTTLEKSSNRKKVHSDSFINTKAVMISPIFKKYSTSHKFCEFIIDDVDFSDVDEIDKLIYSPIKKLSSKNPQGMDKLLHAELSFTEKNSPRKYVHHGKTYLVRTQNISPKPNYERMDSPTILKQLYNYGIKPLKREHGVAILEHIYDQTHPFMVENDAEDSSDDEDILKISASPLKALNVQLASQTNKRTLNTYNTFKLEDCPGEKLLCYEDLLPDIDEEEYFFPTNVKSKVATARLPFNIAWYNVVKSSYSLREALLHYEPIDLQEIYLFLKELGYRYDPKDMKKFFDKRCIIFRYDLSDGTTNRHVRKNKRTLSQGIF